MSEEVIEFNLTDDEVLRYTQRVRKDLVDYIVRSGPPTDHKDRLAMLHALSDMDQTAINNKRLGAQQKNAEADRLASLAIAKIQSQLGNANPFQSAEGEGRIHEVDESKLPPIDLVEGETEVGVASTNYEEFMEKFDD